MFSPYYRRALARNPAADPDEHCAINVCLYGLEPGAGAARWTMTERAKRHVQRDRTTFVVGPSRLRWHGNALDIELNERGCPLPHAVRGRVRVVPRALTTYAAALDANARHRWVPIAPCARIEVDLDAPGLRWSGAAYIDSNEGDEPIDRAFTRWDWLRAAHADGSTTVIYDPQAVERREDRNVGRTVDRAVDRTVDRTVDRREGSAQGNNESLLVAQRFMPDGATRAVAADPSHALVPSRLWRIARRVRAQPGARVLRTLEDTPFYARSLIHLPLADGSRDAAMHESLDARRLASTAVQWMLPFRMPRVR